MSALSNLSVAVTELGSRRQAERRNKFAHMQTSTPCPVWHAGCQGCPESAAQAPAQRGGWPAHPQGHDSLSGGESCLYDVPHLR